MWNTFYYWVLSMSDVENLILKSVSHPEDSAVVEMSYKIVQRK